MAEVKWIKLTVNMFDDEKIQLIQSMPEGDAMLVIWTRLILLAGKCNCGGYVYFSESIPYTEEMLSTIFHKPLNIIKLALRTFEQFKMIESDQKGIYLVNFEKYQNASKLDAIREYNRLAKQKERERKQTLLTANVNDMSLKSQTCQETDIDLDIDIDLDKDLNKESRDEPKKPRTFVPPSLQQVIDYCNERGNGVDPQRFIDFYEAKGWFVGKNKMKDWKASVRTWENRDKGQYPKQKSGFDYLRSVIEGGSDD